jgi:menaquinone-dependent protoporphyrinogen oxidase
MADSGRSGGRVLVAYATKHGSTREVAEAIATTLQEQGLRVDLKGADACPSLDDYGAVVLGGALYMGHWHKDARRFVDRHHDALATTPLAIFAMGPKDLEPASVADARSQLDPALKHLPEPGPIAVEIFGGVIDPSQLHFPFDHMPATDARDWDAISAWARDLARQFSPVCQGFASMTLDGMR